MRRVLPAAAMAVGLLFSPAWATAQTAPITSEIRAVDLDSGAIRAPAAGAGAQVVYSGIVAADGAPWIRLKFDEVHLAGSEHDGNAAFLRITSFDDAAVQTMNQRHVGEWRNTSAYFNGDAVLLEVLAFAGTGDSVVRMSEVTAGLPPIGEDTICGPTDDRTLSSDPRAARLLPIGCSGWIISDCGHCFLTAGHCTSPMDTVQFNVPLSSSTGGLRHPGPEDQYPVDPVSMQTSGSGGIGNDWGYFGVHPNSTTGLTPFQRQGQAFNLAATAPSVSGQSIRITGYGTTGTGVPREWNQVQKTHVGPYAEKTGTAVRYRTDTTGGNSGSPVIDQSTGLAIGIHSHGGCTSSGGSNAGTAIEHPGLQAALAAPRGVCCDGPAGSGSLVTGAPNNGSGGVFMELTNLRAPLRITSFDLAYTGSVGDTVNVEVWTRPGSYDGFDASSAGWSLSQTVQGVKAGETVFSPLELTTPLLIDGQTAVYLQATGPSTGGIRYNGTASSPPQTLWSNSDLEMFSDVARTGLTPFGGSRFTPRTFAGIIRYEFAPGALATGEPNNGSGGVFMDLTNLAGPLQITSFDVAYTGTPGDPVNVEVWTRPGSYVGFDDSSSGWTRTQTVQGVKAGETVLSPLELTTPILIDGQTAVYLQATGPSTGGIRYNGTASSPPQTTWANDDIELSSDVARTGLTPFGGSRFTPRTFAGVVRYEPALGSPLVTGEPNNGRTTGQPGCFFDLIVGSEPLVITGWDYYSVSPAGTSTQVSIFYKEGSYVRFDTSPGAWTLHDTVPAISAGPDARSSLRSPEPLALAAGRTYGVYFRAETGGIRYRGATGVPPTSYTSGDLTLEGGIVRADPFGGTLFDPRIWSGAIHYELGDGCYADCDGNGRLDFFDFLCFQNAFTAGDRYADCDGNGRLDFFDFLCFQNSFTAGCP